MNQIRNNLNHKPDFKFCKDYYLLLIYLLLDEVKCPKKNKSLKLNLNVDTSKIIGVDVNLINSNKFNSIIQNELEAINSQKIYEWRFEGKFMFIRRKEKVNFYFYFYIF